jgi:hypothetical protein
VYLNEKNMDVEVGIDVYDVPAPKKIRCLAGIQLCTLTKKSWIQNGNGMRWAHVPAGRLSARLPAGCQAFFLNSIVCANAAAPPARGLMSHT